MYHETAYLSLGSNLGDRFQQLEDAVEALQKVALIRVLCVSSIYETEPQDVTDQPWFLNSVVAVSTSLAPFGLLTVLQTIEQNEGRVRTEERRRGPRLLDIDILFFGQMSLKTPELTIPHYAMLDRRFVLEPLVEIAPDLTYPGSGVLLRDLLKRVQNQKMNRFQRDRPR